MFISKKELKELKKIKMALWTCENVEKLDLWKMHKTLNEITKKIDKRRETTKIFFACVLMYAMMLLSMIYWLNGYSF